MKEIIKNKCFDIEEIQNNKIYIDCRFTQSTNTKTIVGRHAYFINCEFARVHTHIFCRFSYFSKLRLIDSHVTLYGNHYYTCQGDYINSYFKRFGYGR